MQQVLKQNTPPLLLNKEKTAYKSGTPDEKFEVSAFLCNFAQEYLFFWGGKQNANHTLFLHIIYNI